MEATVIRREIKGAMVRRFALRRQRADSILAWGLKYFPHYFDDEPGKHHVELDAYLRKWTRKRKVRVAVEGPRGCAKSTLLTFLYPIWLVCLELEDYIILFADTHDQAVKYLESIKEEFETNDKLANDYPDACGKGKRWNEDAIITANGIRVEALGAGQSVRGRKKGSKRPSCMIIDDPEGEDAAYSKIIRNKIRNWATKAVMKAGQPRTNIIIAGTVVHRECLVAHCGQLPGWKRIQYKSIIEWPTNMDMWDNWERMLIGSPGMMDEADAEAKAFFKENVGEMIKGAEVLWPQRESLYDLMYMRASEGHTAFESEKQNNPIDPSKCEWSPDLFDGDDMWFDEWPKEVQCAVMSLDPSKGKSDKGGDYQAIVSICVGDDGVIYADADMARRGMREMVDKFIDISKDFRPDVAVVEDVQFQELLVPEIEERSAKQGLLMPVEPISTGNIPKVARIRRLGPYISRRRIKYRRKSKGATLMRQQNMDFPNSDFDDGSDALEMAVRRAQEMLADFDSDGSVEDPR